MQKQNLTNVLRGRRKTQKVLSWTLKKDKRVLRRSNSSVKALQTQLKKGLGSFYFATDIGQSIFGVLVRRSQHQLIKEVHRKWRIQTNEDQGLVNYSPQAKCGLLSVFINKDLLEHSHTHLFMYGLWLLLCLKNIYYLALCRKDVCQSLLYTNASNY